MIELAVCRLGERSDAAGDPGAVRREVEEAQVSHHFDDRHTVGRSLNHAGIAEHLDHAAGEIEGRVVDATLEVDVGRRRLVVMIETVARTKVAVAVRPKVFGVVDPNELRPGV